MSVQCKNCKHAYKPITQTICQGWNENGSKKYVNPNKQRLCYRFEKASLIIADIRRKCY